MFLAAGLGLGLGGAAGAYGTLVEPLILRRLARYAPAIPAWSSGPDLRIVALADIHMAPPFMTLARLEAIVDEANRLSPDIVVLLGDYAEGHGLISHSVAPREVAGVLSQLRAPLGTWAVMGNHDWATDRPAQRGRAPATRWHDAFSSAGIEVLSNRAERLSWRGRSFWISGLESQLAYPGGAHDVAATLEQITDEAPALLLAHEPDIFAKGSDRFALQMSGHTHGGQVRIFGRAPIVPSAFGERYAYGHVEEEGRHLIVSSGIGCSRLPIRIGTPPEIVEVALRGA